MVRCFRFVSSLERQDIEATLQIRSRSGITYFAIDPPSWYYTMDAAERHLALPHRKAWSLGPIHEEDIPSWDVVPPQTVAPQKIGATWMPGGGTEAATSGTVTLLGFRALRETDE